MRSLFIQAAVLAALTSAAGAAELVIDLPGDIPVERVAVNYDCGGTPMSVEYVNAGPVSLAVFDYEGEPVVASAGIAASGVRYAGGKLIWWTKGASASLYDLTEGEDAAPIAECTEKS
ncbi:MliC family protein [Chelativorans sp. J32]|uniref:MliC family protein n=1 Tax=Chelativorans sp. J32 TaxID=935840 RepID=UPI0004B9F995|nr:MliC family protein [Chelativorans sp. J32]